MKKCLISMILLLCAALTGCGHTHSWSDPTCLAPQVCAQCGETAGQPLGHSWLSPTCVAPQTCSRCGITQGKALDHSYGSWGEPYLDEQDQWQRSCSCTVCGQILTEPDPVDRGRTDLGSAGELSGTTLLISIFADDATTSWDLQAQRDRDTLETMQLHLSAGVSWLTQQVADYGVQAEFLYNWEEYPDLRYSFDFGEQTLVRPDGGGYYTQAAYVADHIPSQQLLHKYRAQNVIYIFFFNTDESSTVNSWSMSDRSGVETEIINVFARDDYAAGFYYMPAASFAHEIMHCFGAYDLYYASDTIPQAYVDHCAATGSNDIMYTVGLGQLITQELSRLDAYYMGLLDSCQEVEQWGLGQSSHLK